jgi:hypothetical protein
VPKIELSGLCQGIYGEHHYLDLIHFAAEYHTAKHCSKINFVKEGMKANTRIKGITSEYDCSEMTARLKEENAQL